jgi:predicted outer membrane repeat protein
MDLQTALGSAACTEIWVAAGVYKPTSDINQTVSFVIASGTAVYGGFAGGETLRTQRNLALNLTTLSGDIGTVGVATDNSHTVVKILGAAGNTVTASTVLDGFTISDSHFSGSGGGLYCGGSGAGNECSPTLSNLVFANNYTYFGGGLYDDGSNGGVSSPHLTNVTFINNYAINSGGGMFNDGGNGGNSSPVLDGVTFSGNNTDHDDGGAIYNGGQYNAVGNGSPTLNNVTFSGNGVFFNSSPGTIYGGAIDHHSNGMLTLNNVTFSGNGSSGYTFGGAIFANGGSVVLSNAILWGDVANSGDGPEIYVAAGSVTVTSSVIQGGCPSGVTCVGVIDSDPLLGSLQDNGGPTQTMLPADGSSAVNAGYNPTCASTDQRGVPRPQGVDCDMGAVEVVLDRLFADNFDGRPTP